MGMKKWKIGMTEQEKLTLDRYAEWVDFRKKDGLISDPMDHVNLMLWLHYNDPDMQKHVDHLLDLLYANYNL
jgi:hypothetical protein